MTPEERDTLRAAWERAWRESPIAHAHAAAAKTLAHTLDPDALEVAATLGCVMVMLKVHPDDREHLWTAADLLTEGLLRASDYGQVVAGEWRRSWDD